LSKDKIHSYPHKDESKLKTILGNTQT